MFGDGVGDPAALLAWAMQAEAAKTGQQFGVQYGEVYPLRALHAADRVGAGAGGGEQCAKRGVRLKIAILGAGGVRTPLIVGAMLRRRERLGLTELALMDVDAERLDIIGELAQAEQDQPTVSAETGQAAGFKIVCTTDARAALAGADFVITTFRVGGIASRVVDERVPLRHGVLGQETTGPGGFAMAMRTIPVLLDYHRDDARSLSRRLAHQLRQPGRSARRGRHHSGRLDAHGGHL